MTAEVETLAQDEELLGYSSLYPEKGIHARLNFTNLDFQLRGNDVAGLPQRST